MSGFFKFGSLQQSFVVFIKADVWDLFDYTWRVLSVAVLGRMALVIMRGRQRMVMVARGRGLDLICTIELVRRDIRVVLEGW